MLSYLVKNLFFFRYDMPLVLFDGINQHGQTIILACALISREDNDSYIWVFPKFLQCMKDLMPGTILTDQCKSIANRIEKQLSGVLHRFYVITILPLEQQLRDIYTPYIFYKL